ncbi:MAG: hypothetical protein V3S41_07810 [Spirochaetia bacterium]
MQDQLILVAGHWWLLFLSTPGDLARAQMLSDLGVAVRSVSAEMGARAADLAREHRATAAQVRRLKRVVWDTLSAVGAPVGAQ